MNIIEMKNSGVYEIKDVDVSEISTNLSNRLHLFGIRKGRVFRVLYANSTGCTIVIQGNEIAIGSGVAQHITVEAV